VKVATDAELRAAIQNATDGDTITFTADITLTADLPAVQKSVTIDGMGHVLDGADLYRGFFFAAWSPGTATLVPVNAMVKKLKIQHCLARGGDGGDGGVDGLVGLASGAVAGGGGAGLGGAIFVAQNASVTLSDVNLAANAATGGNSGGASTSSFSPGGGGGLGGKGGNGNSQANGNGFSRANGGGGGLGSAASGGNISLNDGSFGGIAIGAAAGGGSWGNNGNSVGGAGGGGGGAGGTGSGQGDAGGGGGGVGGATALYLRGGDGGFGGGGGGASNDTGGNGGFGGGGGAIGSQNQTGGAGGFGGGGGGSLQGAGGVGGFGGGNGSTNSNMGGGGGAGLGGAIFVMEGGHLSVTGELLVDSNSVTGGTGGHNGTALGSGIFIQGNNTITFSPADGETQTINDAISDQSGAGGGFGLTGNLTKTGAGTLVLNGTNTIASDISVQGGQLLVTSPLALVSHLYIRSGGTFRGSTTVGGKTVLEGTLSADDGPLTLGSLDWSAGGMLAATIGGPTAHPVTADLFGIGYPPGPHTIALADGGVQPGQTYTILTFSRTGGIVFTASDFTVIGLTGTLAVTDHAITFTVPVPVSYGVATSVAEGKNRATFTITNTGNTTTSFRLSTREKMTKSPRKSSLAITYTRGGRDITKALDNGKAVVTIPAGGSEQVVVKANTRGRLTASQTITTVLTAISQVSTSAKASTQAKIVLKAGKN
jgi:hypothetical protein